MLLYFIFVIQEEDYGRRNFEFNYIKDMARFYRSWLFNKFKIKCDVKCDTMLTRPQSILQRLDTHTLLSDHKLRGSGTFHFYLTHFRPLWTDCTCEGYHAPNFAMIYWQRPKEPNDTLFLAEKNCTVVSHELLHEVLRISGTKRYIQDVHDVWTRHFYDKLEFEQYDVHHNTTLEKPMFLTMDTSSFVSRN